MRDLRLYVKDILVAIDAIESFVKDVNLYEFKKKERQGMGFLRPLRAKRGNLNLNVIASLPRFTGRSAAISLLPL